MADLEFQTRMRAEGRCIYSGQKARVLLKIGRPDVVTETCDECFRQGGNKTGAYDKANFGAAKASVNVEYRKRLTGG
jgi:hypothetical protein